MKNLSLLNVLLMAFAIFAVSSCTEDDPIGGGGIVLDPSISFVSEAGFLSSDSEVAPGATFSIKLRGSTGDNQLNSLTIKDNNVNVDASRITFAHTATANNPQLVVDTDKDGFTWELTITAHDDLSDSPYDFIVTDGAGNTAIATIFINTANSATPPTVTIDGPTAFTGAPGSANIIKINATAGSSLLSTIAVYENDILITDLTRLDYNDVNFTANPQTLEGDDVNALSSEPIIVRLTNTSATYRFEVEDASGLTGEADVVINVGTLVTELTGQLLNQAGPAGTGGLDLDINNGGVGSTDASAEIKDEGINGNPLDTNWKQQISGANGSVIKLASNLPEGSKYENITTIEEIEGAFDNSDDLVGGVSDVVGIGDQFVVENNGNYYFLLVTNIFISTTDNTDYYEFSIKK